MNVTQCDVIGPSSYRSHTHLHLHCHGAPVYAMTDFQQNRSAISVRPLIIACVNAINICLRFDYQTCGGKQCRVPESQRRAL